MQTHNRLKQKLSTLYKAQIPLNIVLLLIVLIFFLTIFIGFFFFSRMYFGVEDQIINISTRSTGEPVLIEASGVEDVVVLLYSMDGFYLEKEQLKIALSSEAHQRRMEIIRLFLNGPYNKRFQEFYSSDVEVKSIFVQEGILILNLSENFLEKFNNASLNMTVVQLYSLINTLLVNMPEMEGVQILIEGTPRQSLNDWIDISVPLIMNQSIIRG